MITRRGSDPLDLHPTITVAHMRYILTNYRNCSFVDYTSLSIFLNNGPVIIKKTQAEDHETKEKMLFVWASFLV